MSKCFMVKDLHVVVVYIHVPHCDNHKIMADRFVSSYIGAEAGYIHESVVICNGSKPSLSTKNLFAPLENLSFLEHDDSGWDIGAYQKAAREIPCDLMVFFGGSTQLVKHGWLGRMVDAFLGHGAALYGTMGHRGDTRCNVYPHLRTNGFWIQPSLFNQYPIRVTRNEQRYEFEHGKTCLTGWITRKGMKALVVTWDGEYDWPQWDSIPNGYHRGDQSNLLIRDRLTEPPYYMV